MAEALINQLGKGRFEAVSAGSNPAGYVHPETIVTLERHRIWTRGLRSKPLREFSGQKF